MLEEVFHIPKPYDPGVDYLALAKARARELFKGRTIVVTGASGLLGIHLVEQFLYAGAIVRAVIHERPFHLKDDNLTTVRADLTVQEACDSVMSGADIACLCASKVVGAGVAVVDPAYAVTDNLVIASRCLHAAAKARMERILLVSSTTVYPDVPDVRELDGQFGEPHVAYQGVGNMKRYIEILAKFYQDKYEVQCAIVRPVPYYGRFDNFELGSCHVIPALIRKAVDRQNPFEVWGSGYESRDFLHVSDVARGCLLALDRGIGKGAINLGSGTSVRINELAAEILRLAGHRPETVFNASRPSTIRSRTMSVDKARQLLGFRQSVSMTDGLKDTIDWYRGYSGA